jgi:hypothetical protein
LLCIEIRRMITGNELCHGRLIRHVHLLQTVEAGVGASVRPLVKVSNQGFSRVHVLLNKRSCARNFLKPYISGESLVEMTIF